MSRFLVSRALVKHQSVQLPDGTLHAVQMAQPASAFAVLFETAGHREIISLHADEETAVQRVEELAALLEVAGAAEGGRVLQ